MADFREIALCLSHDDRAVTLLEYALIAGIIVATIVIGFTSLGGALSSQFSNIGANL